MYLRFIMVCYFTILFALNTIFANEQSTKTKDNISTENISNKESQDTNSDNKLKKKIPDQVYYKQFQQVFERINKDYVQDPDRQKMTDAAINGMLMSLDPHSSYFTDEDLEDFISQTKGEFGGIGVEITFDGGTLNSGVLKVISPIDDLPADKAGVKAGDYIIAINDELVSTLGFYKAVKEMRGDPGTKVKITIITETDPKPREIELTRAIVKIKPVKAHLEDSNIGYIRIVTFNEHTIEELRKAFKKLESESKTGIQGIILDLRNNPGGLLDQGVAVSEFFIDSGIVVTTKGRTGYSNSVLTASKFAQKAPQVPLIVMINSGSASASEIVAGAIQDHKRGLIIGTKSFGKASVQTFVQVSPRAAVKLTTAKYYTPNGRSIQADGIDPDIVIEPLKVEFAEQKSNEKRFSESSLKNYLKNDQKGKDDKSKKTDKDLKNLQDKADSKEVKEPSELYKKDYQFARAYDLIRGLILSKTK
jgi:carboxyl-terminal processing protease